MSNNLPLFIQEENSFNEEKNSGRQNYLNDSFISKNCDENDDNEWDLSVYSDGEYNQFYEKEKLLSSTKEDSLNTTEKENSSTKPFVRLNQTDAWNFISNKFQKHCKNTLNEKMDAFSCCDAIEKILESNKCPNYLNEITSFLREEISKPKGNLFSELKMHGYLDTKIIRILKFFNEKITENNEKFRIYIIELK